jgi:hypothetical protein
LIPLGKAGKAMLGLGKINTRPDNSRLDPTDNVNLY